MIPRCDIANPGRLGARAMSLIMCLAFGCASAPPTPEASQTTTVPATVQQKMFTSPEAAIEALVEAAENGDAAALAEIFGPDGMDLVVTGDPVLDTNQAAEFAAEARIKTEIVRDPENPDVATVVVGPDDWPAPIPIVNDSGSWRFDTAAGRQEILFRRIGKNELDAIEVCRGFVEAQYEYAFERPEGVRPSQFAQRIVSSPGKKDGLAWQTEDGSWEGPVGEAIARIIAEGYTERFEPFHGYYFKVLKGQGPSAPMGEMNFVVGGIMIGGFALVAAPADYEVTGVMTFIVSHDGVVYQKDVGPETLDEFRAMELYNPDSSWAPVSEE
jgi:hypothetical protein